MSEMLDSGQVTQRHQAFRTMREHPIVVIGAFVLGLTAFALVQQVFRGWGQNYVDRAAPQAELLNVRIGPKPSDEGRPLKVPRGMLRAEQECPFVPSLKEEMSVTELREWLATAQFELGEPTRCIKFLDELLAAEPLLDREEKPDDARLRLLRRWTETGNRVLEAAAISVLAFYRTEVPEMYRQKHPEEWLKPERAVLRLRDGTNYSLEQAPEDGSKERAAQNAYRRYWIHMNASDLRWLFSKARSLLDFNRKAADDLVREVSAYVDDRSQPYLLVDLWVSNDGRRSMCLDVNGALEFRGAFNGSTSPMTTPLEALDRQQFPVLIEGQKGMIVRMCSTTPVKALNVTRDGKFSLLQEETVRSIFDVQSMQCLARVMPLGFKVAQAGQPISSHLAYFGSRMDSMRVDRLISTATVHEEP